MSYKECRFRNAKSPEARMRACFSEATYDWADDPDSRPWWNRPMYFNFKHPDDMNKEHHLEC
jgi:hypothetical protein